MNSTTLAIYDHVLNDILQGTVAEGGLLPTEMELAARFGVSRMDAHAAVKELARFGIVRSKRGAGTFVCKVPSPSLARHLKGISARRVHVVVGYEPVPLHWSETTLRQLEHRLSVLGYAVSQVAIPTKLTRDSLVRLLQEIAGQGSSALVLILPSGAAQFCQEHAALIFQYHRNIFLLNRGDTPPEGWPFHVVSLDPFSEGVLAAEYLYDKGYRRMAFWTGSQRYGYWAAQRAAGFTLGLKRASEGTLTPEIWECGGPSDAAEASQRLRAMARPCAVASSSDESATWLIDTARQQGLHAPRDFGIIGFDNNPLFRQYNLTTIAPPLESIGGILARVLSGNLLSSEEFSSVVLRVSSHLIERDTCMTVLENGMAAVR